MTEIAVIGDEHLGVCPRCQSTYDTRKHRLETCDGCGAETSTACCHSEDSGLCGECNG